LKNSVSAHLPKHVPAVADLVVPGKAGGARYKAQNNTQSIPTDPDTISRFSAELISEHFIAQKQSAGV
jgi:hypothetical protein